MTEATPTFFEGQETDIDPLADPRPFNVPESSETEYSTPDFFEGQETDIDPLDIKKIEPERSFIERAGRFLGDWNLAAAQGATFGFSDEIAAYVGEQLGLGDYDTLLSNIRARHDEISSGTLMAGELAGGIGSTIIGTTLAAPLGATAAGAKGAAFFAKLPGWLRAAGLGSLFGGLYGFGTGEGGLEERGKQAGVAAAIGAGAGLLHPLFALGKSGLGLFSKEINKRWHPTLEAYRRVQEAIKLDDLTPAKLRVRLRELGPQATIADAGGPNIRALAREAAKSPGGAMNRAMTVLGSRAQGEGMRIVKAIHRNVDLEDFYAAEEMFLKKFETQARPVYQKAYEKYKSIMTPALAKLLKDPDTQKALQETAAILRRERNAGEFKYLGAIDDEITELANYAASVGKMAKPEKPGLIKGFSLEAWDQIKRGFDVILDDERLRNELTGKLNNKGRSINLLRKKLLQELDNATGGETSIYAKARKTYGDIAESLEALRDGRQALKADPEIIAKELADLSDAGKEAYKAGFARAMKDVIFGPAETATTSTARKLFANTTQKQRIRAVFPKSSDRQALEKILISEQKFNDVMREVMPKRALLRIDEEDFTKRTAGAIAIFAGGSEGGILLANIRRKVGEALVGPQNQKFKAEVIKLLVNRNPTMNLRGIDMLFQKVGLENLPPPIKYELLNELLPLFAGQHGARIASGSSIHQQGPSKPRPTYHTGGQVRDFSSLSANLDKMPDVQREKHLRSLYQKDQKTFNRLLEYLENR
jgi:hypothetical protein